MLALLFPPLSELLICSGIVNAFVHDILFVHIEVLHVYGSWWKVSDCIMELYMMGWSCDDQQDVPSSLYELYEVDITTLCYVEKTCLGRFTHNYRE